MLNNRFEVFDDARDFVARTRPILVERHDFSAKLFRDKECTEPTFSIAGKGEHRFDIYKILGGVALFLLWLGTMKLYFGVRRAKRRRKKAMKRAAKMK